MAAITENEAHLSARTGFLVWSAAILLVIGAPFIAFVVGKAMAAPWSSCPPYEVCAPGVIGLNWAAIVSCSALFGATGVMASLILRRRLDPTLSGMAVVRALVLVYGLGAIFSVMLLALFIGGFVQGNLFPNFASVHSWVELLFRVPDWGKLAVWSFIVGFSERLMPGFLDQLGERFDKAQNSESS